APSGRARHRREASTRRAAPGRARASAPDAARTCLSTASRCSRRTRPGARKRDRASGAYGSCAWATLLFPGLLERALGAGKLPLGGNNMGEANVQSYANHVRWDASYHFFAMAVL